MTHNALSVLYRSMGDYTKSFDYANKALKIQRKSLNSKHPLLSVSYMNIGQYHREIKDYTNALSFYRKALK